MGLLTVRQAANRLQVAPPTVYGLCAEGKLRHLRIGVGRGTIRVDEADLAAFIEGCKVNQQPAMNAAGLKHIKPPSAG